MAKDYYVILGISADATQDEIKSAYRKEAKRCHPDCTGEDSEPFLKVREAYEVLSDPRRRRVHDAELARERRGARWTFRTPRSARHGRGRPPIEPWVTNPYRGGDPASSLASLIADLFPGQARPSVGRDVREFHVEVALTREQARHGGRLRVWVPVHVRCPACHGLGSEGFFECLHCFGVGIVVDERPIDVTFRGGVADGDTGLLSLRRRGMPDLSLVLHFRMR